MRNWVLLVGYDKQKNYNFQQECLKNGILVHVLEDTKQVIQELLQTNCYMIIVIFSDNNNFLNDLKMIRNYTKIPILVVKNQYSGIEKVIAINAGADEYIQYPETISECIASFHALIRRFTELNLRDQMRANILSRGNLLICVDYRKVIVGKYEITLPRREFDLFYLLASKPEWVFTYEQLFDEIWKNDYVPTDNSLHSCINRIRRKLEKAPCNFCVIENIRGVGYCFRLKEE